MKKLLVLLAACAMVVACGDDKKSAASNDAVNTLEAIYQAIESGDLATVFELVNMMEAKYDNMSEEEKAAADSARDAWFNSNPKKAQAIMNSFYDMN